jgi:glutamate synthase (NADPH) large chain
MTFAPVYPGPGGLYDPTNEHDACGVAMVAKLWGEATHAVIEKGLEPPAPIRTPVTARAC